jgi:PadR family transcriptional regulator PadR
VCRNASIGRRTAHTHGGGRARTLTQPYGDGRARGAASNGASRGPAMLNGVDEIQDAVRSAAGAGSQDPLIGDLRRGGLLPLLVLHFVTQAPCYGNQLIERIAELTAGALAVNPNTMYPLLRNLEARGLVRGEWEHPERRSRRFYSITEDGRAECAALLAEVEPRLRRIGRSIQAIRAELRG